MRRSQAVMWPRLWGAVRSSHVLTASGGGAGLARGWVVALAHEPAGKLVLRNDD